MKIKKVELLISNFEQTVQFYEQMLQFKILSSDEHRASFQIGESVLELIKDDEENHHYYHFAFNIHANMFKKAKEWLSERVELLKEDGLDEIDFKGITQANACYFDDPAGNIVEFIARRETSPVSNDEDFSTNNVLCISEISLSTNKISEYAQQLKSIGIPVRHNEQLTYTSLNFMGEYEDGSFILLGPLGRRWLFSTKEAVASPVTIHTDKGIVSNL